VKTGVSYYEYLRTHICRRNRKLEQQIFLKN